MHSTWNRVQEGSQGTMQDARNLEQGTGRITGNNTKCREHGTGCGKDDREQYRMQGTWNRVWQG